MHLVTLVVQELPFSMPSLHITNDTNTTFVGLAMEILEAMSEFFSFKCVVKYPGFFLRADRTIEKAFHSAKGGILRLRFFPGFSWLGRKTENLVAEIPPRESSSVWLAWFTDR